MQFEPQEISVRVSDGHKRVQAMVGVGSGLAYGLDGGYEENGYILIHLQSGFALKRSGKSTSEVTSPYEAQCWLERVASLLDWTQEKRAICDRGFSIAQDVEMIHDQIEEEATVLLKSLLHERHVKMIETYMMPCDGDTFYDVLTEVIEEWFERIQAGPDK